MAQSSEGKIASMSGGGSAVSWDVSVPNSGGTLTITAPDGRAFRRTFRAGASPQISLSDKQMDGLPDGSYSYELRLTPELSAAAKEALVKARGKDDDPENERAARKRPVVPALVQAGSFAIVNGIIVLPGAIEGQRSNAKTTEPRRPVNFISGNTANRLRNHRMFLGAMPDVVTADDEIIQGSACVGLDCVSGEVFGFDTIRLKENNTRIQFDDTSTSAGFPTNNWQIRANNSASGGASFLAFVDQGSTGNSETGTIVFEVDAGAAANALKVSSTSKVGLRTATPVLDIHMNTSDTPAMRMEQNNTGGFTAQTWDVAGNEANFFVRDVTSGSRLPFRIRPGAPTSSIDISASGNVGIGIASPAVKLDVRSSTVNDGALVFGTSATTGQSTPLFLATTNATSNVSNVSVEAVSLGGGTAADMILRTGATSSTGFGTERMRVLGSNGRVGIGTGSPDQVLSVNGDASKVGGGSWQSFSDERLKNIKGKFNSGLSAVMRLQPLRYEYKSDNALGLKSEGEHIGFGAQALQKVIPEAVTKSASGYLMVNNDPIMWTMLNAIKEQQKEIAELKNEISKLKAKRRVRHR
jgi:hypothetical protein